jgi:hypothetical protein
MLTKIVAAGLAATFAVGLASVASARDYDDIQKDRGIYVFENGAPYPYSEYQTQPLHSREVRQQPVTHRHSQQVIQSTQDETPGDRW